MTAFFEEINSFSAYPLIALLGCVLGSSNMAVYLAKLKGVDLKASGSGNPGASNALITMGWRAAVLVCVHDLIKCNLAVYLAGLLFPEAACARAVAGAASILGQMYPFYMHFRGGKGYAAYLAVTLALDWRFALCLYAVLIVILLVSNYVVVCTFVTIAVVPIWFAAMGRYAEAVLMLIPSAFILWKHRENIKRLKNGTEIGLRSAGRGDHRVKGKKQR
ncbi:MAG: glycerol-3-phosphate acyltransferase [Oscillospiraceae bacterium]|nr:glycerol-3-phosphate acyltransferase [Oscillospiraceae bacterium]